MKTNTEKKQEKYNEQIKRYIHLKSYLTLEPKGLEDDSIYYHINFHLDENTFISSQCDVGNNYVNIMPYALKLNRKVNDLTEQIDIYESWFDKIVISWLTNRECVLNALTILQRVKEHIRDIESFTTDYVNNLIIGESINDITNKMILELKTVNSLVCEIKK